MVADSHPSIDAVVTRLSAELGESLPLRGGPMWMRSGADQTEIVLTVGPGEAAGGVPRAMLMESAADHPVRLTTVQIRGAEDLEALVAAARAALGPVPGAAPPAVPASDAAGRSAQRAALRTITLDLHESTAALRAEVQRLLEETRALIDEARALSDQARRARAAAEAAGQGGGGAPASGH